VVNTCAFIAEAQAEAGEAIREALRCKRAGSCRVVVVAGCLPQYLQERCQEAYPEVDAWLTPDNPGELGAVLRELLGGGPPAVQRLSGSLAPPTFLATSADGRVFSTPPSLAYVKIAEGCSHKCRFCIIPRLRGKYRSRKRDDVLKEVAAIARVGLPEIVLVSQDSRSYGRDLGDDAGLAGLLESIHALGGDFWLRVMYLHPDHLTDELLDRWAQLAQRRDGPRLLPYFDVPVQHVSARVLKSMGRRGDRASIEQLFAGIRRRMPEAVIRTSLIVGYPGETEDDFNALLDWVQSGAVDRLGVFTYSDCRSSEPRAAGPRHRGRWPSASQCYSTRSAVSEERNRRLRDTEIEVVVERTTKKGTTGGRLEHGG
jgi:ribosomal protein S12 methylthiotransferase